MGFELGHDGLEALLEVAAIAGAGEEGAHVEREDRAFGEDLGHVAFDDALGQAFGDGGLADAGVTDIERVVFRTAAQDLDRALDFGVAADQRIDLAGGGLFIEVDAVVGQRVLSAAAGLLFAFAFRSTALLFGGALGRALSGATGGLGDTVTDEIDGIERVMSWSCRK